jgi:hypothetical protein
VIVKAEISCYNSILQGKKEGDNADWIGL